MDLSFAGGVNRRNACGPYAIFEHAEAGDTPCHAVAYAAYFAEEGGRTGAWRDQDAVAEESDVGVCCSGGVDERA